MPDIASDNDDEMKNVENDDLDAPGCDYKHPRRKPKKFEKIELIERFDVRRLQYILEHRHEFKTLESAIPDSAARLRYLRECYGSDYDPYAAAEKYLKRARRGVVRATYHQGGCVGRFHAVGGVSQQGMPLEIRHTIAAGFYDDIDIVNAHPTILAHICGLIGKACPMLSQYVENRETCISDMVAAQPVLSRGGIRIDADTAKHIILAVMNGGNRDYNALEVKTRWLIEFRREVKEIHAALCVGAEFKKHVRERRKAGLSHNHEASYVSLLMCDYENRILMELYRELGEPNDCVLCFDGLQIARGTDYNLRALEGAVMDALGIRIKLKLKPMNRGFVLPDLSQIELECEYTRPTRFNYDRVPVDVESKDNGVLEHYGAEWTYTDFHAKYNRAEYACLEDARADIVQQYPHVIAKIMRGQGFYVKKAADGHDTIPKLGMLDFKISAKDCVGGATSFGAILDGEDGFDDIECKLSGGNSRNFNIWSGFQARRIENPPQAALDGLELMKSFLFDTWASGNREYYNYIVSWLCGVVSTRDRNGVAMVLISEPGTGKGFFINFLRLILRQSNIAETVGIRSIAQKHNALIQNKRLVVINEMSSTKEEFRSNFETIKTYITDPVITIEPKGVNAYSVENIANYIMCSNHEDSIIVEEKDRRYSIFEVSPKYRGNYDYFTMLHSCCFTQDVADAFYTYLLDFEQTDEFVNILNIPDTAIRRNAVQLSKSAPLRFVDYITENPLLEPGGERMTDIPARELYERYERWCRDDNEARVCSMTKFGRAIAGKLEKHKSYGVMRYRLPTIPGV